MEVKMEKICNILHGLKPAILMVIVQTTFAGINVLYKLASNDGMNLRILVAYRFLFAAAFLVPVALIVERNKRPKLTLVVIFQAFLCGLFGGSLLHNMYVQSLALTSATFVSATSNLIPAITFVLSISFRLEKLNWDKSSGKAKVLGTLISLIGAMVLTFYKGLRISFWNTHVNLLNYTHHHGESVAATHPNRTLGACLAMASCICYALWLIPQTKIAVHYPCPYSSTALMTTMASIQSTVFALCMERDWTQWKLGWNIRLLTIVFSGLLGTGMMFTLVAWCVRLKGPLFVSVFNPLMLVLVAIAGSLLLDEQLRLGSVIGSVTIICGLYVVLWGKGMEQKRAAQLMPKLSPNSSSKPIDIVSTSPMEKDNAMDAATANHSPALATSSDKESTEIKIIED